MQSIRTCLIEENSFVREGLRSLLSQTNYAVSSETAKSEDIDKLQQPGDYQLVILGIDDALVDIPDSMRKLKSRFPAARFVLLSDSVDARSLSESFSCGADGYILKNISPDAFIGSLNLVMMGEKVFPATMASLVSSGWKGPEDPGERIQVVNGHSLSDREMEIVTCLASGEPNKVIAKQLNITEATVKVHLKTILRKLGLTNRTQAAIWAVNNGITPRAAGNGGYISQCA